MALPLTSKTTTTPSADLLLMDLPHGEMSVLPARTRNLLYCSATILLLMVPVLFPALVPSLGQLYLTPCSTLITYGSPLISSLQETDQTVFPFQVPDLVPSPLFRDNLDTYGPDLVPSPLFFLLDLQFCQIVTFCSSADFQDYNDPFSGFVLFNHLLCDLITHGPSLIPSLQETDQLLSPLQVPNPVPSPLFRGRPFTYGAVSTIASAASPPYGPCASHPYPDPSSLFRDRSSSSTFTFPLTILLNLRSRELVSYDSSADFQDSNDSFRKLGTYGSSLLPHPATYDPPLSRPVPVLTSPYDLFRELITYGSSILHFLQEPD